MHQLPQMVTSVVRRLHFCLVLPVPEQDGGIQSAWQRAAKAWPSREGELPEILTHNFFCFSPCPEESGLGSWEQRHMPFPAEQLKQPKISHCAQLDPKGI